MNVLVEVAENLMFSAGKVEDVPGTVMPYKK